MKRFDINAVKKLVSSSPIKEIRGRFRFNIPTDDWEFGQEEETYKEQFSVFENFLKEVQPWAVFETEKGEELGKFVIEYNLFDADPPEHEDKEYFFSLPFENGESILLTLFIEEKWPYCNGGGKFSISLELE